MISANSDIFEKIYNFYESSRYDFRPQNGYRYIGTSPDEKRILRDFSYKKKSSFNGNRHILHGVSENQAYLFLTGFPNVQNIKQATEINMNAGLATCGLSILPILPIKLDAEAYNNVAVSDSTEAGYEGHSFSHILQLFPEIRVFTVEELDLENWDLYVFMICLDEVQTSELWISKQMAESISILVEMHKSELPYNTLTRAVFDADPSSLFLALYRCLEALYAHQKSAKLTESLGIDAHWTEVAKKLETTLGWWPREQESLEQLLCNVHENDLINLLKLTDNTIINSTNLARTAAKKIYNIRNGLVHYRRFHIDSEVSLDWDALCLKMIDIIFEIYGELDL